MLTDRASLDDALWRRVRRIAERVSAGEIDGAIAAALEINDVIVLAYWSGVFTHDEAHERERAVRASLLAEIGPAMTLRIFVGEYDARAARGDTMTRNRERVIEKLRARLPVC